MSTTLSAVAGRLVDAHRRGDAELVDATHDSRQAQPGWLFCAVPGQHHDGHDAAADAVGRGAAALLVERWLDIDRPQVCVASTRAALGPAAAAIHGDPSRAIDVAGVTGTNGKTTVTYLLEAAFAADGRGTGVIGTVATRIHGQPLPGALTTPEGSDLQRLLADMQRRGVTAVAMEVSSHGLALHRVDGTRFTVAVFTNLSQDHLDFHGSMGDYFEAKARLFTPSFAEHGVVWCDDEWGSKLRTQAVLPFTCVGRSNDADARIVDEHLDAHGGQALLAWAGERHDVTTRLVGRFNLDNAVLAYVAAVSAGVSPEAAGTGIASSAGAPGRLERVDAGQSFHVLVDYAHTPDAIRTVVRSLREIAAPTARIVVVIGAGGDRDRDKRGPMGRAAADADVVVVTSDNPRGEQPMSIADAVARGARAVDPDRVVVEIDRRHAIRRAIEFAGDDDIVLIAGKGHETTQQFADHVVQFDDREVAHAELVGSGRAEHTGGARR